MCTRLVVALLIAYCSASQALIAQHIAEAGAGFYFGHPSSLNGPVLFVRHLLPAGRLGVAGLRVEFRDDDNSGGRSQAIGASLEGMLRLVGSDFTLYVPASVGLEGIVTTDESAPQYRDIDSGLYPRLAVGLGFAIGSPRGQAAFEVQRAFSTYGSYTAITLGAHSQRSPDHPAGWQVLLYGNTLDPFGSAYRREPDFRGYTIALQRLAPERRIQGLRVSFGIDFLDFGYSTGLIAALGGIAVDLARTPGGVFTLRAVPQVGVAQFAEGRTYPRADLLTQLGLEVVAALGNVSVMGGVAGTAGTGPAGGFTAVQYRFGAGIGL